MRQQIADKLEKVIQQNPTIAKRIKEKDKQFIIEYLVNDENATKAAVLCGYSKKSAHIAGYRVLKRALITEIISKIKVLDCVEEEITIELCKQNLYENYRLAKESGKIAEANKALELLLKMMGAFGPSVSLEGTIDMSKAFDELKQRAEIRRKEESKQVLQ